MKGAILIKSDATTAGVFPANGADFKLKELQGFVGGLIEIVYLTDDVIMVINEEGKDALPLNMMATVITDWNVTIDVCEDCTIDPGPWNGNFTITDRLMNVRKPQDKDEENLHGADYYQVTPLKNLGFGCIMYTPHDYEPLEHQIIFTYSCILKPLTNKLFVIFFALLFIIFIIATTIMLLEGKLIRVEEENQKLEDTVKERTKELEAEKNRSENLLLNILPKEIAKELTEHPERTIAKEYPNVTACSEGRNRKNQNNRRCLHGCCRPYRRGVQ